LLALVVDVHADDVGGEEIGGALDAGELAVDRARQRAGEGRLAHARIVLDQRVSLGHERYEQMAEDLLAYMNGALNVRRDALDDAGGGFRLVRRYRR
jgi:hypothetical protein